MKDWKDKLREDDIRKSGMTFSDIPESLKKTKVAQCPEFPYFGASYPDARCINGYLQDMDDCDDEGNIYLTKEEQYPCPFCNTEEFMQNCKDNEEDLDKVRQRMEDIKKRYS